MPAVHEEYKWQHGPFGWNDFFWAVVEENVPVEEEIPSSLLLEMEDDHCSLMDSNSILCFNLECYEFPPCICSFESGSAPYHSHGSLSSISGKF